MKPIIEKDSVVLFQGDSITDCDRNRDNADELGKGYAMIASACFSARHPELNVKFLNRGCSGDRAVNLMNRWDTDCIQLKPNWISIMVGINDSWRRYDSNDATSTTDYEHNYKAILKSAREKLNARFILIEPFVLPYPEDRKTWREDLNPRIEVVHKLAAEFGAVLIKMDKIFAEAITKAPPIYWSRDGVHPTPAGHALIAQSWLDAVQA